MEDDRLEQLLSGYRLPEVSPELDPRVLMAGAAILERGHTRATLEEVARSALDRLGFGYLTWLTDLVTTHDAEYRVVVL